MARFLGDHEDPVILSEAKNLAYRPPFNILRYAQDDHFVWIDRDVLRKGCIYGG